jgi:hypothetical protein
VKNLFKRKHKRSAGPFKKKIAVILATAVALIVIPSGSASAAPADFDWPSVLKTVSPASWLTNAVNGQCGKPGLQPEVYGSGFDGMAGLNADDKTQDFSPYGQYGTSGLYWNWVGVDCLDFSTPVGNQVANLVFNIAKTIDTVTITVYKKAASNDLIDWLKNAADSLIRSIGSALKVGYLTLVFMLGALALIWWGLFKRRATRVTEGTIWMVCATAAFLILINRPEIFTSAGSGVTSATDKVISAALSPMAGGAAVGGKTQPAPKGYQNPTVCIPQKEGNWPQNKGNWSDVNKNVNSIWSVLICKPWLQGEFGTADPNAAIVKQQGEGLIYSQAFTHNDIRSNQLNDDKAKKKLKDYYAAANAAHKTGNDGLFTGKQYLQRIGIAFAALFAALVAGLLILLLSLALIIFKLGFLLLLITGPVFLLIGVHPGWGRVIAIRWVELLLSSLLKQALVAALLGLLLFLYAMIMGNGDLPWVIQIVLIALVSFAAFFYRKPFQHLFAAVGTDSIGSRVLSNATTRSSVFKTGASPLVATARVNRWSLRKTQPITDAAASTGHPAAMAVAMASRVAGGNAAEDDVTGRTAGRINEASRARGEENGQSGTGTGTATGRPTTAKRSGTSAPPLNLQTRPGEGGAGATPGTGASRAAAAALGSRGGVRPGAAPQGPRPGGQAPRPGAGAAPAPRSGSAPVTGTGGVLAGRSGAASAPRRSDAPPPIRTARSSGSAPPRRPGGGGGGGAAPSAPSGGGFFGGGGGSSEGDGPRRSGGLFGASWRRGGGDNPESGGGGGGSRRSGGGGGWFGGGSRRGNGGKNSERRESAPRRSESNRDNSSGPAPWRKRTEAPPLWAKPSQPPAPDIPFWTRPDK